MMLPYPHVGGKRANYPTFSDLVNLRVTADGVSMSAGAHSDGENKSVKPSKGGTTNSDVLRFDTEREGNDARDCHEIRLSTSSRGAKRRGDLTSLHPKDELATPFRGSQ